MEKWSQVVFFIVIFISSALMAGTVEQKCEYVQFKKDQNGEWLLSAPYDQYCTATFGGRPDEYLRNRLMVIKGQFQQQMSDQKLQNCEIVSKVRLGVLRDVFPYDGHHYQRTFSLKLICDHRLIAHQYFKISSEVQEIADINEVITSALARLNSPCQECLASD